jgi:ATP-binding cassette, subfamily B, bacterial
MGVAGRIVRPYEQVDEIGHVRRALAGADVADLEQELPRGLETPLGRAFLDGVAGADNPLGTITVIVSHRFSTVRAAHLVAVVHDGRVVESGTHAELVKRGGRYAAMYRTQAEGYV